MARFQVAVMGLVMALLVPASAGTMHDDDIHASHVDLVASATILTEAPLRPGAIEIDLGVANTRAAEATNATLLVTLPKGIAVVEMDACELTKPTMLSCDLGSLLQNDTASVVLGLTAAKPGTFTIKAAASSDQTDHNTADNKVQLPLTVAPWNVDLVLADLTPATEIFPGDAFTLTYNVNNSGPDAAGDVRLLLAVPKQVDAPDGCEAVPKKRNLYACALGELAPGANVTAAYDFVAGKKAGALSFKAEAILFAGDAVQKDAAPRDNKAVTKAKVVPPRADISIALEGNETAAPGELVTLTVTIANDGPSDASGVQAKITLPKGAINVTYDDGDATCNDKKNVVTCGGKKNSDMASGVEHIVVITYEAPAAAKSYPVKAEAKASQKDPAKANNKDALTLAVSVPVPV